jgi:lipoprotein-anchoring transpeptidase ErfK/SrfK
VQQYNGDASSYQQQYAADQHALQNAASDAAYKSVLAKLQAQVNAIKIPALKTEANALLQELQQGVTAYGQNHSYHDTFNNITYPLGYEYGPNGVGGWAAQELSKAQTLDDYQQTIEDINVYLTNFQAMVANVNDKTPANQVHQTDIQLMQHYGYTNTKVVIVSLEEQAARIYQNGKLVNSFLVTTGRPEKPTPPGTWWIEVKKSPDVFKAGVPQSSPYWYPDTPINYAMQYHSDGYFLHDSWWRNDYGPGTNFPHADSSGDSFSSQGSHGCVNISKANAAWLYGFVELDTTRVVIY